MTLKFELFLLFSRFADIYVYVYLLIYIYTNKYTCVIFKAVSFYTLRRAIYY